MKSKIFIILFLFALFSIIEASIDHCALPISEISQYKNLSTTTINSSFFQQQRHAECTSVSQSFFLPNCIQDCADFAATLLLFFFPEVAKSIASTSKVWPKTVQEMEELLGTQGTKVSDLAHTPGRDKVIFQPSEKLKITYEQHPYHPTAPDWHKGPHWHLDIPGQKHIRYLPGDPIPGM